MAIFITIGNKTVGKGKIYPHEGRRGGPMNVPQYELRVRNSSGNSEFFSVTRDTVATTKKVEGFDECPPSRINKPYQGIVRRGGPKGFRIELCEAGVPKRGESHGVRGIGENIRYNIQIHLGPAKSDGCILLADWKRGRDRFQRVIEKFIDEDIQNQQPDPKKIYVEVKKR